MGRGGSAHGGVRAEWPLPARDRLVEAELAHWEELGALYLVSQYMRNEGRDVWSPGQQSQTCDRLYHIPLPAPGLMDCP